MAALKPCAPIKASSFDWKTIWIGFIQWLNENGFGIPKEPILKPLEAIKHQDAILAHDAAGQPVEPVRFLVDGR